MIIKESEYVEGKTMAHWTVWYYTKSRRLYNATIDAIKPEDAMKKVASRIGFGDFYRRADGSPIVKRMIYANEVD